MKQVHPSDANLSLAKQMFALVVWLSNKTIFFCWLQLDVVWKKIWRFSSVQNIKEVSKQMWKKSSKCQFHFRWRKLASFSFILLFFSEKTWNFPSDVFCNLLIWLLSELFFSEVSFLFPRPSYFPLPYFCFCVILMKFFLSFFVLPQIWFCSLKQTIGYNKMVQFSRCCSPRRRSKARASRWLNGSLTGRLSITLNAVPQPIKGQSDVWSTTAAIIGGSICEKPQTSIIPVRSGPSANVGAYDGGGGLMCFSPETLSSSDIKRKYAEHKTEEEGQKKNKKKHCVVLSVHFRKT